MLKIWVFRFFEGACLYAVISVVKSSVQTSFTAGVLKACNYIALHCKQRPGVQVESRLCISTPTAGEKNIADFASSLASLKSQNQARQSVIDYIYQRR